MDDETIESLARLSRIHLSDEEKSALSGDLAQILAYVEQLTEVDVGDTRPCNNVIEGMVNVMREDEIGTVMERKTFLDNAPDQIGGMVRVPEVIKGGES